MGIYIVVIESIILTGLLIWWITNSYCTYKRLDKLMDKIIADTEMNPEDKRTELLWQSKNIQRQKEQSFPLFYNKFDMVADKAYIANPDVN